MTVRRATLVESPLLRLNRERAGEKARDTGSGSKLREITAGVVSKAPRAVRALLEPGGGRKGGNKREEWFFEGVTRQGCVDVCVHVWFAKGSSHYCFATELRQIVLHGLSLISQLPCLAAGVAPERGKEVGGWKEVEWKLGGGAGEAHLGDVKPFIVAPFSFGNPFSFLSSFLFPNRIPLSFVFFVSHRFTLARGGFLFLFFFFTAS